MEAKETSANLTPRLYETQDMIRRFGRDINSRMAAMTRLLSLSPEFDLDEDALKDLRTGITIFGNLNNHLRSAADMVSLAFTVTGANAINDRGSDFGDVFLQLPNDQTLYWIESNRITKTEPSAGQLASDRPASSGAVAEWESDDDMDLEIIRRIDPPRGD